MSRVEINIFLLYDNLTDKSNLFYKKYISTDGHKYPEYHGFKVRLFHNSINDYEIKLRAVKISKFIKKTKLDDKFSIEGAVIYYNNSINESSMAKLFKIIDYVFPDNTILVSSSYYDNIEKIARENNIRILRVLHKIDYSHDVSSIVRELIFRIHFNINNSKYEGKNKCILL